VAIYRHVTKGSFDAYMWQALKTKARFIGQVITGDNAVRRAEDIGDREPSYSEVKAIARAIRPSSRSPRPTTEAVYIVPIPRTAPAEPRRGEAAGF
jgi:hypothetical protein